MKDFPIWHIASLEMIDRLDFLTLKPKKILCDAYSADLISKKYPDAELSSEGSVDLIFSNLELPWCRDYQDMFKKWQKQLKPEGVLVFSSLGPDTLQEMKSIRNLNVMDMHDVGDQLLKSRFKDPVLDVDNIKINYKSSETLATELNALKMIQGETAEKDASFEIVYALAFGSEKNAFFADEEGTVRVPLSHLRLRHE